MDKNVLSALFLTARRLREGVTTLQQLDSTYMTYCDTLMLPCRAGRLACVMPPAEAQFGHTAQVSTDVDMTHQVDLPITRPNPT